MDGANKNLSITHNTVGIFKANNGREESENIEVSGRMGDTFKATRKCAADDANGDIGAAHYGACGIGGAQANDDRGDADVSGGSSHFSGARRGHKAEHMAAGTDSAKAMSDGNDAAQGRVVKVRTGGGGGADEESDAMRSPALDGVKDETVATGWAKTAYISDEGRGADDCRWDDITSVGAGGLTAGGANGGVGAVWGTGEVAHAAPRSSRVPELGPNAPPIRSPPACGLTNMGNTCFLNASLQCLVGVRELKQERAQQPWQRKTIQSRLIECITQLQLRPKHGYTPRPLLDALPRLADQLQKGWQADGHEFLVFLLDKMDQGGPLEVFYGSMQMALTCSNCPHRSVRQVTTSHLSLNLELSIMMNSTVNQCLKNCVALESAFDGFRCGSCDPVRTSTLSPLISTLLTT